MNNKEESTTIRVHEKARRKLQLLAYQKNMKIIDIIDEMLAIKKENRKEYIKESPSMVQKLLNK